MGKRSGQWPKTCSPECKDIKEKKRRKARYLADPEGARRKTREWYAANKERAAERGRQYREANKDEIRAKKRAYMLANSEKESARKKAWHRANRDRLRARWQNRQTPETRAEAARKAREWAARNPERKKKDHREYYLTNPTRTMVASLRRRARKRAVASDSVALAGLLSDQDSFCYLCGEHIDDALAYPHPLSGSIDHVIPLVRGGSGLRENLRAAHLACNLRKGTKLLEELRLL